MKKNNSLIVQWHNLCKKGKREDLIETVAELDEDFGDPDAIKQCPGVSCLGDNGVFNMANMNKIAAGSMGVTYETEYEFDKKDKPIPVLCKVLVTDSVRDLKMAEDEVTIQEYAYKMFPRLVNAILYSGFCHVPCLESYQGLFRIVIKKLGMTLGDELDEVNDPRVYIDKIATVADIFDRINKQGIFHFDVHAWNVMGSIKGDKYKLIDFGLSKIIKDGKVVKKLAHLESFMFIVRTLNNEDEAKVLSMLGNKYFFKKLKSLFIKYTVSQFAIDYMQKNDGRTQMFLEKIMKILKKVGMIK
jgi:tRNA A-37 threonylcarbamoyl transferase component Bud32